MKTNKLFKMVLSLLIALLFSSWGIWLWQWGQDHTLTVKVIQPQPTLLYLPFYVSLEEEFFFKEGLNIELHSAGDADKACQDILANKAHVLLASPELAIYTSQRVKKSSLLVIAQVSYHGYYLIGRTKHPIPWKELKGKVILGTPNAEIQNLLVQSLLRKEGYAPFYDVHLVTDIPNTLTLGAFLSGSGDYLLAREPLVSRLEKNYGYSSIIPLTLSPELITSTIIIQKDFAIQQPNTCQALIKGLNEGHKWLAAHSAQEALLIAKKYFPQENEALLLAGIRRYQEAGCWPSHPYIQEEHALRLQEILWEEGELTRNTPLTNSLQNAFNASIPPHPQNLETP